MGEGTKLADDKELLRTVKAESNCEELQENVTN